jgi:hypothetical protein
MLKSLGVVVNVTLMAVLVAIGKDIAALGDCFFFG